MGKNNVDQLPTSYTSMKQITLPKEDVFVPPLDIDSELRPQIPPLNETLTSANDWLNHEHRLL